MPPVYAPRLCALPKCRKEFTPRRSFQRYCRHQCSVDAYSLLSEEEKVARRTTKAQRHPKARYIYEALKDTEPGLCPWCDEPMQGREKTSCSDPECRRAYRRAYRVGRTEVERRPPLPERSCACGCGTPFTPRNKHQKYAYVSHERAAKLARRKEARRLNPRPIGRPKKQGPVFRFGAATESPVIKPLRT